MARFSDLLHLLLSDMFERLLRLGVCGNPVEQELGGKAVQHGRVSWVIPPLTGWVA
jgi:hypothetical protein